MYTICSAMYGEHMNGWYVTVMVNLRMDEHGKTKIWLFFK